MSKKRRILGRLKASNKKHQAKKDAELPRCTLCGHMEVKLKYNLWWCKKHIDWSGK